MSEETKTMRQHFVPREHLRRFEKDGKIIVYLYDENKKMRHFTSSAAKECNFVNYYDDDPYLEGSIEKMLKHMEDECQHEIDIAENNITEADRQILVKYVSMLMNRSILLGMITDKEAKSSRALGVNGKAIQGYSIQKSNESSMFDNLDQMNCIWLTSYGREFITANVPVTSLNLHEFKELPPHIKYIIENAMNPEIYLNVDLSECRKALAEQQRYVVHICPISSSKCLLAYRKDYSNFFKDFAMKMGPDPVLSVNRLIVYSSFGRVYSSGDKDKEISEILRSSPQITGGQLEFTKELKRIQRNGR